MRRLTPIEFGHYPIDGKPMSMLQGMIYWYGWGDDEEFDIRIIRRILGLAEEQPRMSMDKWFMSKRPNRCKAYGNICKQIRLALADSGRTFADVLAEHDRIVDKEAIKLGFAPEDGEIIEAPF